MYEEDQSISLNNHEREGEKEKENRKTFEREFSYINEESPEVPKYLDRVR